MKYYVIICFLVVSLHANTQEQQSETDLVIASVENYFYGYIERDENKLNKAFDLEHGTMKIPVLENQELTGYSNAYFKEIIPKWGNRATLSKAALENCKLTILSIHIESNKMATVKMKMQVGTTTYIDILSLQKINAHWKITNKMFIEL